MMLSHLTVTVHAMSCSILRPTDSYCTWGPNATQETQWKAMPLRKYSGENANLRIRPSPSHSFLLNYLAIHVCNSSLTAGICLRCSVQPVTSLSWAESDDTNMPRALYFSLSLSLSHSLSNIGPSSISLAVGGAFLQCSGYVDPSGGCGIFLWAGAAMYLSTRRQSSTTPSNDFYSQQIFAPAS
jgi:hypothetical protein